MLSSHSKEPGSGMLKYDQTGEVLHAAGLKGTATEAEECAGELGCSVLTPEQIYSQLSMVLHSGGPEAAAVSDNTAGTTDKGAAKRGAAATRLTAASNLVPSTTRKPVKRRAREKKSRKGEQPKRAKEVESRGEKRPRRRLRKTTRPRSAEEKSPPRAVVNNAVEHDRPVVTSSPPLLLSGLRGVHVVEISPEKNPSPLAPPSPHPPSTTTIVTETISVSKETCSDSPINSVVSKALANHGSAAVDTTTPLNDFLLRITKSNADLTPFKSPPTTTGTLVTTTTTSSSRCHGRPLNYELLGRLIGQPLLTSFYQAFHSHSLSEHLKIELLDPLGRDSGSPGRGAENLPRWLQITQRRMHIDPHLGPVMLARILVSNTGIVKFQHLYPVARTVYMQHVKSCDVTKILSELGPRHVLCPGLPDYAQHHVTLGYHPSDVRITQTLSPGVHRYDHFKCPILHVPRSQQSTPHSMYPENMCSKCSHLHSFILRLIWDKFSRMKGNLDKHHRRLDDDQSPERSHGDESGRSSLEELVSVPMSSTAGQ